MIELCKNSPHLSSTWLLFKLKLMNKCTSINGWNVHDFQPRIIQFETFKQPKFEFQFPSYFEKNTNCLLTFEIVAHSLCILQSIRFQHTLSAMRFAEMKSLNVIYVVVLYDPFALLTSFRNFISVCVSFDFESIFMFVLVQRFKIHSMMVIIKMCNAIKVIVWYENNFPGKMMKGKRALYLHSIALHRPSFSR